MISVIFFIVAVMPYIVGVVLVVLLIRSIININNAKKQNNVVLIRKHVIRLIIGIIIIISVYGISVFGAWQYENKANKNVKAIHFTVYGTGQKFNTELLRYPGSITVPHVSMNLVTAKGNIHINEAEVDKNIENLFNYPSYCDVQILYEYTSVWGLKAEPPTSIACESIVLSSSDWKLMTPKAPKILDGNTPYAAILGNTVITFRSYSSSTGDFNGTKSEALEIVKNFLVNSKPVTVQELLKK